MFGQGRLLNYEFVTKVRIVFALLVILGVFWNHPVQAPTNNPTGNLPLAPERLKEISIIAVGDILLSRQVGKKIDQSENPNLPFEKLQATLSGADLTFGNLECPLDSGSNPIREGLIFRCLTKYVPGLVTAGFDVLSTANNHAMDQGLDNLKFTREYLRSQNILPIGSAASLDEAWQPQILQRNGTKFAFLAASYASINDNGKTTNDYVARIEDLEHLKASILKLKSQADFIIVNMHAGTEYTSHPNQKQIAFAHAAIDAGADVVIGQHPHWIQDIEIYQNKPIFYSLGNFVFDQMWSQETREGLVVRLAISDKRLEKAELIPVIIENYCCPRLASDEEKTKILKEINQTDEIISLNP